MTIYYIDPNASVNGNGLSESSPFNACPYLYPTSIPSDTVLLFKAGTTHIVSSYVYAGAKSNIRISSYGIGRAILKNTNTTPAQVVHILNCSNVEVDNIEIDGLGLGHHGILTQVSNANQYDNVHIHDNDIYNCSGPAGINTFSGIYYSTLYTNLSNYLVEDNLVHDNYASGIHNIGEQDGAVFRRNKLYRNGREQGAHNFSCHPHRSSATTGWVLVSGTIYSRTFVNNDVFIVNYAGTPDRYPVKNTVTPTSPGLNEFGWVSNTIYLNVGEDPNGKLTNWTYSRMQNMLIEYNESYGCYNWEPYPYDEGHGIALDDWAGPGVIRYNYVHDNEGVGLNFNKGPGSLIYGNIIVDNGSIGISGYHGIKAYNNIIIGNKGTRQVYFIKRTGAYYDDTAVLTNNIIDTKNLNNIYGIDSYKTEAKNNCLNGTGSITGVTTVNVIYSPHLLDANYMLQLGSLCIGAGIKYWGTAARPNDFYGSPLPDVGIDIGAIQSTFHPFHPSNM